MEDKIKVVFRKFKEGDIIALFPDDLNYPDGCCQSYQQIGQHGAADYNLVISKTKPATLPEYADLLGELACIGYALDIRKRR